MTTPHREQLPDREVRLERAASTLRGLRLVSAGATAAVDELTAHGDADDLRDAEVALEGLRRTVEVLAERVTAAQHAEARA